MGAQLRYYGPRRGELPFTDCGGSAVTGSKDAVNGLCELTSVLSVTKGEAAGSTDCGRSAHAYLIMA